MKSLHKVLLFFIALGTASSAWGFSYRFRDDDWMDYGLEQWSPLDYEGYLYAIIGTDFEAGIEANFFSEKGPHRVGVLVEGLYYKYDEDEEFEDEEFVEADPADEEFEDEEPLEDEDGEEINFSALFYLSSMPDDIEYRIGFGVSQTYEESGTAPLVEAAASWDNDENLFISIYGFYEVDGVGAGAGIEAGFYWELFWDLHMEVIGDLSYSEEGEEELDGYLSLNRYLFADISAGLGVSLDEEEMGVGLIVEMEL